MSELTWTIDRPGSWDADLQHFPAPVSPWMQDIVMTSFVRGFTEGAQRMGLMLHHMEPEFVNGFLYVRPMIVGAPERATKAPPYPMFKLLTLLHPAIRRRLASQRTLFETRPWREDVTWWESTVRPRETAKHLALQEFDLAAADDTALAAQLVCLQENAEYQYRLHHRFTVGVIVPVADFITRSRDWTGLPAADLLQACRHPGGVATASREHFDALVEALRGDPSSAGVLSGDDPLADISATDTAAGKAARAWLELVGNRLVTGYDIVDLVAAEMPALLVRTVAAALHDSRADIRSARREEAVARVRDAVPGKHRAEYDAALAEARSVSNLREDRSLVCDFWANGLVRRAVQESGRRAHAAGRISDPSHLFDARHEEMLAVLTGTGGPDASELAERHARRIGTDVDQAPRQLGGAPADPPPVEWYPPHVRRMARATETALACMFDEPEPRAEPKTVRGLNASAGSYEGVARLVLRPTDFARVRQGDVLIARSTTEAYNGIMPLLGAVVTDRGGLLSHTATIAREFGIPAVVGTTLATKVIPDGARVLVDGTTGVARLV